MTKNYDLNGIAKTASYTSIYASYIHIRGSVDPDYMRYGA